MTLKQLWAKVCGNLHPDDIWKLSDIPASIAFQDASGDIFYITKGGRLMWRTIGEVSGAVYYLPVDNPAARAPYRTVPNERLEY